MEAIKNITEERILFSPLNWGWGHVSRSIPLLRKLQKQGNSIFIACSSEQREIYCEYLKDITYLDWVGYPFIFKGKGNFGSDLFQSARNLKKFGERELIFVADATQRNRITMVLSDHRYFFRVENVQSIFVTHQINLPVPWYLKFAQILHQRYINKFDEVWVVDDKSENLAGRLSQANSNTKPKVLQLGVCSRFSALDIPKEKKWTTVLVSGPEPYARQFYAAQKNIRKSLPDDFCIIYKGYCEDNMGKSRFSWKQIDDRLQQTKKLIARSGYSTIMDAYALGCDTEWYPTPGQWEQEYLADRHDYLPNNRNKTL